MAVHRAQRAADRVRVPAGLEAHLPHPGVVGQMGLHHGGRHRLATAGPEGPGAGGQPAPRARLFQRQPGRGRQGTADPVPRRAALVRAVLARDVPAAGDPGRADRVRDAHRPRGGAGPVRQPEGRPRRGHRAAPHGQLRAGRGLGRGARSPARSPPSPSGCGRNRCTRRSSGSARAWGWRSCR